MQTKVVFIIDSCFPYVSGGRETWLYEHCKRLEEKYDITIITMKRWKYNDTLIYNLPKKIKLISIPTLYNIPIGGRFSNIKLLWGGFFLFSFLSSVFLITKFFLSNERIILISLNQGQTFIPSLFVRGNNIHRICTVHGPYVDEMSEVFPLFNYIFKFLESIAFEKAHVILLNGFDTKKALIDKIRKPDKIKILPNGVDYNKFLNIKKNKENSFKKILMVCSLSERRGTDHLIQATAYIKEEYKNFKVCFVGKGNIPYYMNIAKKFLVEDFVEFLGERTDIPVILANSDIVVCLTDGLGISLSTLEAMASGKAIVAWDTYHYSQILKHNYSGYLVRVFDPASLGKGLIYILNNPDFCSQLGINAQKEAEKFDWNSSSEMLNQLISLK